MNPPHGAQLSPDQQECHEASRDSWVHTLALLIIQAQCAFTGQLQVNLFGYQMSLMLEGRKIILGYVILSHMSRTQSSWKIP